VLAKKQFFKYDYDPVRLFDYVGSRDHDVLDGQAIVMDLFSYSYSNTSSRMMVTMLVSMMAAVPPYVILRSEEHAYFWEPLHLVLYSMVNLSVGVMMFMMNFILIVLLGRLYGMKLLIKE
jgi:hypothetical protein